MLADLDPYTNYFNEIFLQCKGKIFLLSFQDNEISKEVFSIEDFQQYIEPIVDTIGSMLYYSNYNVNYPAFEYLIFNRIDCTNQTLRYFVDEELMQRYRSQYRDLGPRQKLEAFRLELQTGIDKEIHSAFMTGFPASPFYQPLYIPMFVANDTLLIFDHVHNKLIRYNNANEPLDSAYIEYHKHEKNLKWSEVLLQDDLKKLWPDMNVGIDPPADAPAFAAQQVKGD